MADGAAVPAKSYPAPQGGATRFEYIYGTEFRRVSACPVGNSPMRSLREQSQLLSSFFPASPSTATAKRWILSFPTATCTNSTSSASTCWAWFPDNVLLSDNAPGRLICLMGLMRRPRGSEF